jgi:hypothetical protein
MPWLVSPNLHQGIAPLLEGNLMNTFKQNHVKDVGNEMPSQPTLYTLKQAAYLLGIKTTTMHAQINKRTVRVCESGTEIVKTSKVVSDPKNVDQEKIYNFPMIKLRQRLLKG